MNAELIIDNQGNATVCGELAHQLWDYGKGCYPKCKVSANNFYVLEPPCQESGFTTQWDIRAAQSSREGAMRYMGPDRVLVDVTNAPATAEAFAGVDDARAQRANIIDSAQPLSDREQTALDAALFERTRADKLELAMRRALLHLGRRERLNAVLELQNALLP